MEELEEPVTAVRGATDVQERIPRIPLGCKGISTHSDSWTWQ
jgi:hypothetical protein